MGVAVLSLLVLVAIGVVIWLGVRPTPQRDAAAAQSWTNFHHYAVIVNGWQLLYVHTRYEDWGRGSKAYVALYGDPASGIRDSWFWWHHVQPGAMIRTCG